MSTLDSTERFPWARYDRKLAQMRAVCMDRDAKGRNHDTPMLDMYTVADLVAELKHRHIRLAGADKYIAEAIDHEHHRAAMKTAVEDALDMANYAVFLAVKLESLYDDFQKVPEVQR